MTYTLEIQDLKKEQGYFCEACPATAQKKILFVNKAGDIISQRHYCRECTAVYLEQRSERDLEDYHFRIALF